MQVVVNGEAASWSAAISGGLHGSVLGPLLFMLYVDGIPNLIRESIKLFADDAKLWKVISTDDDRVALQSDLQALDLISVSVTLCQLATTLKLSNI
jgi:ribonucleases P/MRP protein subunit RPP40